MAYRTLVALGSLALVLALDRPADAQVCGDDAVSGDEACDDGNVFGGDGCAANCTLERDLLCALAQGSNSTIQSSFVEIPFALSGQVVLTVGGLRNSAPQGPVPFVFRAADAFVAPSMLPGIAIACTTVVEAPGWGPGNAGGGVIDCGATRLDGVDVVVTVDAGQPSPTPVAVRSGGGPVGSAIFELGLANYNLLDDSPFCAAAPGSGPPAFGPDAIPCTADDPSAAGRLFHGSTGDATARVVGGEMPIERSASGDPIDCTQLDGSQPFGGAVLVAALPILALPQLGDAAVAVALHCSPVAAVATPTPRFVRTCVPTPTPTSTPGSGETPTSAPTNTATVPSTVPPSATNTIAVASPNATSTATHNAPPPTPTIVATGCAGDCNRDRIVTIDELVRAVNIALGSTPIAQCAAIDGNLDGAAGIEELIRAVNNTLQGCPS